MTIRQAASDYKEEIRDGIAYVAIWKIQRNGRRGTWCERSFWADDIDRNCNPIFSADDVKELTEIVKYDSNAIILNGYYCGWWRDYTIADIANAIRAHYDAGNFIISDTVSQVAV